MSRTLRFLSTALLVAFGALRRNLLRGALTAFGILIGVAAVTLVVALGDGASRAVSGRIDSIGNNALVVTPLETARSGVRDASALPALTDDDAEAIAREASEVSVSVPLITTFSQLMWQDENTTAQVIGSTLGFFEVRAWKPAAGQLWGHSAEVLGDKLIVIGSTVASELFHGEDPVGRSVRIGRYPFTVIGVLEPKGQSAFGQDQDNVVVMPLATLRAKLVQGRPGQAGRLLIGGKSRAGSARMKREVTAILRQRHHLAEGAENDFQLHSQEDFRVMQETILGVLQALLFGVAAISLLVGGIGVMNIMLVSVTERTREIGIRMAIGAREGDIMLQFLVEAVVLCVAGGAAGALVAALAVAGVAHALDWEMGLSLRALAVALATSTAVGVGFGFLPARRAARLDPIQALGRE
ncbi:MAG: ABC transporter permease [Sorangiineae bacterium]|nr:ABC transporter permease [Polyangiaceae bacterium]MEB2324657.1 ABC transporter permease [Sorangiineae bacterium]